MPILLKCESRHSQHDEKNKNYALNEREPNLSNIREGVQRCNSKKKKELESTNERVTFVDEPDTGVKKKVHKYSFNYEIHQKVSGRGITV